MTARSRFHGLPTEVKDLKTADQELDLFPLSLTVEKNAYVGQNLQ